MLVSINKINFFFLSKEILLKPRKAQTYYKSKHKKHKSETTKPVRPKPHQKIRPTKQPKPMCCESTRLGLLQPHTCKKALSHRSTCHERNCTADHTTEQRRKLNRSLVSSEQSESNCLRLVLWKTPETETSPFIFAWTL